MPDLSKPVWLYLLAIGVAVLVAAAIGFLFGQPLLFVTLMLASLLTVLTVGLAVSLAGRPAACRPAGDRGEHPNPAH